MEVVLGLIVIVSVLAVFIAVNAAVQTFVVMKLWGWFLVPAFAVQVPHWALVYGLMLLISYVTYHGQADIKKEFKEDNSALTSMAMGLIVRPALVLTVGAIAHSLVPAPGQRAITLAPVVVEAPAVR